MTRKKKDQEQQLEAATVATVKKNTPKKIRGKVETKVTEAPSSENEVINEDTLMMEVWQEDAANSGTEKRDLFVELFGKERFTEIFGESFEEELDRTLDKDLDLELTEDECNLAKKYTIEEILEELDSSGNSVDDESVSYDILEKFDKDLESKGLGDDYFQKKEEQLKEMELEHENHEFEIDKMLDEEN